MDGADRDLVGTDRGEEEEKEDTVFLPTAELMILEANINSNPELHTFDNLKTQCYACAICKCRVLQLVIAIHHHEIHNLHFQEKVEEY